MTVGAVLSTGITGRAESRESSNAESGVEARAEDAFREGVAAFASGRYHRAIDSFLEADRLRPKPELAYDIARTHEKLGNDEAALRYYREYLSRAGHPDDEAAVRAHVDEMESRFAAKELERAAWFDASPAVAPPDAQATKSEPSRDVSVDRKPSDGGSRQTLTSLGIIGLGAAAASLGAAVVFEVDRAKAERNAENEHEQVRFANYVNTIEEDRTAARIFLGTGAALAATGVVLLVVGAGTGSDSGPKVALGILPGAVNADAAWRF